MRSHLLVLLARTAALLTILVPAGVVRTQQPVKSATVRPASTMPTTVSYVQVLGADYAFDSPDVLPAGIIAFNLVNNGNDLHAMAIFELPAKHTLRDFLNQYHSLGMIPTWMIGLGQTPVIAPKTEAFLTVRMKPGRYILACLIPARDGRMHTEKGMVKQVTVK